MVIQHCRCSTKFTAGAFHAFGRSELQRVQEKDITQHGVRASSPRNHFINIKQPRPKKIQVAQQASTKNEPLIRDGAKLASGESRAENTTYLPNLVNEMS
jgi:hypothetical protein